MLAKLILDQFLLLWQKALGPRSLEEQGLSSFELLGLLFLGEQGLSVGLEVLPAIDQVRDLFPSSSCIFIDFFLGNLGLVSIVRYFHAFVRVIAHAHAPGSWNVEATVHAIQPLLHLIKRKGTELIEVSLVVHFL